MVAGSERQYRLSLWVTCKQTGTDRTVQLVEVCPDCGLPNFASMSEKSLTTERSRDREKSEGASSRASSVDSTDDTPAELEAIKDIPELAPIETWTESEYSKLSAANKKLANNLEIIMGNLNVIKEYPGKNIMGNILEEIREEFLPGSAPTRQSSTQLTQMDKSEEGDQTSPTYIGGKGNGNKMEDSVPSEEQRAMMNKHLNEMSETTLRSMLNCLKSTNSSPEVQKMYCYVTWR